MSSRINYKDQRRKSFREGSAKGFVGGVQRGMSVPRKCPWKRAVGQEGWCGRPGSNWSPEIRVKNKPNGVGATSPATPTPRIFLRCSSAAPSGERGCQSTDEVGTL